MSVYVDELSPCVKSAKWHYDHACHLVADSVEELQDFARKLGLKSSWFQDRPYLPHYDLTTGKRTKAVRLGAIELDQAQFIEFMRNNQARSTGLNYLNLTGTNKSNLYELHDRSRRAGRQSLLF